MTNFKRVKISILSLGTVIFLGQGSLAIASEKKEEFAKFSCVSAEKIYNRAESCEDNSLFSRSAENCYQVFSNLRKKSRMILDFQKQGAQDQLISQGKEKMAEGKREIDFLLAVSQLGIAELSAYLDSLIYPEDWFEDEVTGGDLNKYLMRVKCFGNAHRRIQEIDQQWKKEKAELEAAKAVIEQMMAQSDVYVDSLQGGSLTPSSPTSTNGSSVPQKGKPNGKNYRPSDISGTEEKKNP